MDVGLMQRLQAKHVGAFRAAPEVATVGLVLDSLRAAEPVIVLTGPSGSGKTTVLESVLDQLGDADPALLRLSVPFPAPAELQRRLQSMLDLPEGRPASPAEVAQALLLRAAPAPGAATIAVVLDAAQAAPVPLLRYLSLMQALTSLGRPALQLVLVGEEVLWQRLGDPALAGLCRTIRVRLAMQPFSQAESLAFVAHRLRQRGCWVDPDASAEIVTRGAGLPGRMVALIDTAAEQIAGRSGNGRLVTLSDLLAQLGMPRPASAASVAPVVLPGAQSAPSARPARRRLAYAAVAAVVLAVAVAGWHWRAARSRAPSPPPAVTRVMRPAPSARALAVLARPAVSAAQARFELAVLDRPPSLLDDWGAPPRSVAAAAPSPPAILPPAALPPLGPAVRVSLAVLPPSILQPGVLLDAPPAAPAPSKRAAPLLVLSNATAAKATTVFARGDAGDQAAAWRAVRALRQAGVTAADPQAVARLTGRPGVGYFFAADKPAAVAVASRLTGLLPSGPVQLLAMPDDPPAPGAIRVLLAPR